MFTYLQYYIHIFKHVDVFCFDDSRYRMSLVSESCDTLDSYSDMFTYLQYYIHIFKHVDVFCVDDSRYRMSRVSESCDSCV